MKSVAFALLAVLAITLTGCSNCCRPRAACAPAPMPCAPAPVKVQLEK